MNKKQILALVMFSPFIIFMGGGLLLASGILYALTGDWKFSNLLGELR